MDRGVYLLPGRGGRLREGLGAALAARGVRVEGRELNGDFEAAGFSAQLNTITADLQREFWTPHTVVVANSFGAYLFLHAQTQMPPFVGRVLLFSPILGAVRQQGSSVGFVPPRARRLRELAERGSYPRAAHGELHVGADDWQSDPERAVEFGALVGLRVHVVPGAGHRLDQGYVLGVIEACFDDLEHPTCASPPAAETSR
jgi:alpha-beta hydrolase superfamily lysophospholipase